MFHFSSTWKFPDYHFCNNKLEDITKHVSQWNASSSLMYNFMTSRTKFIYLTCLSNRTRRNNGKLFVSKATLPRFIRLLKVASWVSCRMNERKFLAERWKELRVPDHRRLKSFSRYPPARMIRKFNYSAKFVKLTKLQQQSQFCGDLIVVPLSSFSLCNFKQVRYIVASKFWLETFCVFVKFSNLDSVFPLTEMIS